MKVLVPVINQNEAKDQLAESFHNAESVCIFDFGTQTSKWVQTKTLRGNYGHLAESLKAMGIDAVVSRSMPLMALGFFTDSDLPVYMAVGHNLQENLKLFKASSLVQMTNLIAKSLSECSGTCGSCKSTSCN
jgi:predicted Fe-Mo cluster-binding NifX family protein